VPLRALVALAVLVLAAPPGARGQIVNTLRGFAEEEPGWSGSAEGYVDVSQGNTEYEEYGGSLALQWRRGAHRIRALASGLYKTGRGETQAEESTLHLRHNLRLRKWLATLLFVQNQYDPFQRLEHRFLLGGGLRFDLLRSGDLRVFAGMATMLEDERIEGDAPGSGTEHRLSSFLSALWDLREGVTLDAVGFYQPRWSRFSDLRASLSTRLKVDLVGSLYLSVLYELEQDARPPEGVEKTDWGLRTGLGMEF
jgi:hypothetical protein